MWRLFLTDLNYAPIGEVINAGGRKFDFALNRTPTGQFTVRMDHPLAAQLGTMECYLKAYRNGVLKFFGPVVSVEEAVSKDSATVQVNVAGSSWYFLKRLVGKSQAGTIFSSLTDRAAIFSALVTEAESAGPLPLRLGAASAAAQTTYTAGPYRTLQDCLGDLSVGVDGFDWEVVPIEAASRKVGEFQAAPVRGITRPNTVFEFGDGRHNITEYKLQRTRDTQANSVYHLGADAGSVSSLAAPVTSVDPESVAKWLKLEDLAQATITNNTLRQRLVDEHVAVRKNPRRTISFTPASSTIVPQFGTDYVIGDVVRARCRWRGSLRFDVMTRVYGIGVEIDNNGVESSNLILSDEGT